MTLEEAVVTPFREFFQRNGLKHALAILSFMFLYKLGDSMATALSTPFYQDLGFSLSEIGVIAKNAALWPAIFGGFFPGRWPSKTRQSSSRLPSHDGNPSGTLPHNGQHLPASCPQALAVFSWAVYHPFAPDYRKKTVMHQPSPTVPASTVATFESARFPR